MPKYLVEMDKSLISVLKNSGSIKVVETQESDYEDAPPPEEIKPKTVLSDYKRKSVQGLYHYDHFEHPDGSFIQSRHGPEKYYVHQDAKGNRKKFTDFHKMKDHVIASHANNQDLKSESLVKMRWKEIISESPISDFGTFGDMDKEGSFRSDDLRALKNPKWQEKVFKAFSKTPFNFNVYVYNGEEGNAPVGKLGHSNVKVNDLSNLKDYVGIQPINVIKNIIGKIPPNTNDSINVLLVENEGSERLPLTPWILAHRISHAIFYAGQPQVLWSDDTSTQKLKFSTNYLDRVYKYLINHVQNIMMYKRQNYATNVKNVAKLIGTFRSARTGNLSNPGEFLVEMMAQYLVQGSVKFNRPIIDDEKLTPPLDPSIDKDMLNFARRCNIRYDDIDDAKHAFVTKIMDLKKPNKGWPQKPSFSYVAYKDGVAMKTSSKENKAKDEANGYEVKEISPSKSDIKKWKTYQELPAKIEAIYDNWKKQGWLESPNRTDQLHKLLDSVEISINIAIKDILENCVGKCLVL